MNNAIQKIIEKYKLKLSQQKLLELLVAAHKEGKRLYINIPRLSGRTALINAYRDYLQGEKYETK